MASFAELKNNRKNAIAALTEEVNKLTTKFVSDEDKYWELQVDKAKNGSAVIRFLPPVDGESKPFVRYWEHGFQGPPKGDQKGMWYIEKSLTTLGQPDPCGEYNEKLWETGLKANQEIVRKQKRKLYYVSNIYVVKDPANPDNEGKVFLFKYGKKIFDKINDLLNPVFEDVKVVNPFDLWEGANFRLRAMQKDGYRTYEKSEFEAPSALLDDDDEMEKIWKSQHSLDAVIAPNQFKTYEVLKARLDKVLRINTSDDISSSPVEKATSKAKFTREDTTPPWQNDSDDDDDASDNFFKRIQDDDE